MSYIDTIIYNVYLLCNLKIIKIVHIYDLLGEQLQVKDNVKMPEKRNCIRCGFVSSQEICKACVLLEGLNRGLPKLGIGKSNKIKKIINLHIDKKTNNKV